MEEEIWKDIKGWEGLYQVSNLGRVKSLPRLHDAIHPYMTKEKILKPRVSGYQREYLAVVLHNNDRVKQIKVHRLVAEAFVPNPNGYLEINHIDENKGNNRWDNLEWCTRSYNVNYGSRIQKQSERLYIPIYMLNDNYEVLMEFKNMDTAAKYVNIDPSNISRGCSMGRKSGGYYWMTKEKYNERSND